MWLIAGFLQCLDLVLKHTSLCLYEASSLSLFIPSDLVPLLGLLRVSPPPNTLHFGYKEYSPLLVVKFPRAHSR